MLPTIEASVAAIAVDPNDASELNMLFNAEGFKRLPKPRKGDWIASFSQHEDPLQTFPQFVNDPNLVDKTSADQIIKVFHLGEVADWVDMRFMANLLSSYTGLGVELESVPIQAHFCVNKGTPSIRIESGLGGTMQFETRYSDSEFPNQILVNHIARYASTRLMRASKDSSKPKRRGHAGHIRAVIIVTSLDMYAPDLNYVFGQGHHNVGVYSYRRLAGSFRALCHLALHETLHIFGFLHCRYFQCVMNGSNSLAELQRHPLQCCPVELRKLKHIVPHLDLVSRYQSLLAVLSERRVEFQEDLDFITGQLSKMAQSGIVREEPRPASGAVSVPAAAATSPSRAGVAPSLLEATPRPPAVILISDDEDAPLPAPGGAGWPARRGVPGRAGPPSKKKR